ncbi:MAG TPA: hypothetical protein VK750_08625 [Cytophagaceae bacterium]|jgi:hypothetical protein|nr:hypothetical protein [Cytophagaceae bacterium]
MRVHYTIILLVFFFGIGHYTTYGQYRNIFSLTKSPFKHAEKYYKQDDYMTAITWYEKALFKARHKQGLIKLHLANSYRLLHHTEEAERWYKDIMNTKSLVGKEDMINYAQVLLSNGKYEASKAWFEHYNTEYGVDTLALRKIQGIDSLSAYYEDSLSRPVNRLSINTSYADFSPVFYDNGLVFTSSRPTGDIIKLNNTKNDHAFLDLFRSEFNADNTLNTPKPWRRAINGSYHEGPIVFYDNGSKAIFTQSIERTRQQIRDTRHLGLYNIEKLGENKWSEPVPLPFNNKLYSVAHAAINQNGDLIYFSSNMPGGYGGTDLYMAQYNGTTWSSAINLGSGINTSGNELFPTLFQDSILYFSSTGLPGLGGLDIYRSYPMASGFSEPENMGYPINTRQDDFGIALAPDGKSGYLSSNRTNGGSDDDLFAFEIINVYLKGNVRAKLKNTPLSEVKISLSLKGKEVLSTHTNEKGDFFFVLDPSEEYILSTSKESFKMLAQPISTKHRSILDTLVQDFMLEKEVKTLVKGTVNQGDSVIVNSKIIAFETATNHQDTILSDERGEFFYEADPGLEYLFYVDTKHSFGEVLLEPSKKTKGTFLLYTKIEMHRYDTSFVSVFIEDENIPVVNALVVLENTVTKKSDSLYTNKKGAVRFVAKSYAGYRISSRYKGKTAELPHFNMHTNRKRALVLQLHRDEEVKE